MYQHLEYPNLYQYCLLRFHDPFLKKLQHVAARPTSRLDTSYCLAVATFAFVIIALPRRSRKKRVKTALHLVF
jgi:hypothetical protein